MRPKVAAKIEMREAAVRYHAFALMGRTRLQAPQRLADSGGALLAEGVVAEIQGSDLRSTLCCTSESWVFGSGLSFLGRCG